MRENEIAGKVVDAAYRVHTNLGPGLLESAYQAALLVELARKGLAAAAEVRVPMEYGGTVLDVAFRADVVVEDTVLLEIKATDSLRDVHWRQVLTYLKVSGLQLGLLINFGESRISRGIRRVVNGLPD